MHLPKSAHLWKQSDIISRPAYALLQSHFLSQTSNLPEVHGGPASSLGLVGCRRWSLACESLAGWAGGLHPQQPPGSLEPSGGCQGIAAGLTNCSEHPEGPCQHPPKGFVGVLETGCMAEAQTALLAYPENALSGCLGFRRTRTKFEGFKGRASISKIRGSHRLRDWRGTFPKT